jgi:hypothetical protein
VFCYLLGEIPQLADAITSFGVFFDIGFGCLRPGRLLATPVFTSQAAKTRNPMSDLEHSACALPTAHGWFLARPPKGVVVEMNCVASS